MRRDVIPVLWSSDSTSALTPDYITLTVDLRTHCIVPDMCDTIELTTRS